ncbi:hypothetical protein [Ectobacillus sp. sgz5001026]|uniref:hypothetical protein n=1 Tax=Ectobacillus sp. sgz5001026 TaxID=3242473 RepID=UPI0036D297CD
MFSRLRISMITLLHFIIATTLILCLPSLFTYNHTVSFQPFLYVFAIEDLIHSLSKFNLITFFSNIWSPYSYSMTLLASAFFIAFTVAIILSILYMISNRTMKAWIKWLLFVVEAIPDVMVIVGIQALLIWFLKQTGQMPFQIINFGAKQSYAIPISTMVTKYVSLTSEWAGLIGLDRYEFNLAPWIVLSPLCAFAIIIFFLNLITEGIKDVFNNKEQNNWKQQQDDIPNYTVTLEKEAFTVLNSPLEKTD